MSTTPPTQPEHPTVVVRPDGARARASIDALAQTAITPTTSQNAELQVLALRPEVERGLLNDQAKQAVKARLFGEPEAPARIGRFTVIRELGRGGTGVVYIVFDEQLDRKIAVKLLNNERPDEQTGSANARLLREAQAMARVSHPNIAAVHEVGMFHGQIYVAMEFVRGQTLAAWIREQPRAWPEVLAVYRQASAGLAAAHEAGLVHRDFKPANAILGEDDRVRVLDFGLARADATPGGIAALDRTDEGQRELSASLEQPNLDLSLTVTGTVLGTPAYMSPEQFLGQRVDAKSDQFSFCVSLYEALYRERPFDGDTLSSLMAAVLAGKVREPPGAARVPRWLRLAVLRGLHKDPEQRWPSMRALALALAPDRGGSRWSWVGALGVGVVLTAGATTWMGRGEAAAQVCTGAERQLAGVWDPARRDQVEQAIRATAVPTADVVFERVAERLDAYAAEWIEAHADACEATSVRREQSAELMDLRMSCLAERRHALATTTALLAQADAQIVGGAVDLTLGLPAIARCADPGYVRQQLPPPDDPNAARLVEAAQALLREAQARERVGKYAEGLGFVDQAAATATGIDYAPLTADIALRRGLLLELDSRYADAKTALEDAYFTAMAVGHHRAAIDAAVALVLVTGRRLARPEAMLAWSRHAEAYIRRAGDELQHARLQTNRALGAFLNPTWGDARARILKSRELHLEALRTYEATPGAEVDRGRALMAIAETYEGESRERSSEYYDRSLQTYEALCPDHPAAALVRSARGRILLEADRLDEAQAEYEKGKAILEATVGTRHRSYAFILGGLAHLHEVRDQWAEAEPLVRRAIEIHTASEGKAHLNTMEKRTMLGHVLMKLGRVDESIAEFESVLDDLAANPDVRPYELANLVAYAIDTFIAAERPADLLARVAPLFAAVERATPKDKVIPSLLFNRARLKLAAGAPLAEARADVLQARANAEAMQVPPQVLAEFDAWLAKHPEK